jgi:hypothetical protein
MIYSVIVICGHALARIARAAAIADVGRLRYVRISMRLLHRGRTDHSPPYPRAVPPIGIRILICRNAVDVVLSKVICAHLPQRHGLIRAGVLAQVPCSLTRALLVRGRGEVARLKLL